MGLHTFLYHFALIITPVLMLSTGYYKPKFNHYKGAVLIFVIFAIPSAMLYCQSSAARAVTLNRSIVAKKDNANMPDKIFLFIFSTPSSS